MWVFFSLLIVNIEIENDSKAMSEGWGCALTDSTLTKIRLLLRLQDIPLVQSELADLKPASRISDGPVLAAHKETRCFDEFKKLPKK